MQNALSLLYGHLFINLIIYRKCEEKKYTYLYIKKSPHKIILFIYFIIPSGVPINCLIFMYTYACDMGYKIS